MPGPLVGRTVAQIKNRFYQNLKGRDLSKIKYLDEEQDDPIVQKATLQQAGLFQSTEKLICNPH